ncbi:hypothetical protein LBWT_X3610 (plasmid) [Leptolyngbya boryana IAM M-101]|nr:hypothetical protein LBWT_X3610 [Leptolyngbya boryana IAM M-101]BAS66637.1 hypothetical protein LBDG_X3610 [Leptolyngbya boryana dg5]
MSRIISLSEVGFLNSFFLHKKVKMQLEQLAAVISMSAQKTSVY